MGERFGPTLAAEHLASEDRLRVHAETLRRWMLAEGLWSRERRWRKQRRRRERKEHFRELVQMDGSFHPWLEERGPEGCLIDLADATNTTLAELGEEETIWAVADALRSRIEQHGVPLVLYVVCRNLEIELIAASSPQDKGRIERMHGVHQDRLVKKLRRRGIVSHQAANMYLREEYLPEHNERFARQPARPEDYHRRAPRRVELDRIFRLASERVVSADGVIRYADHYFNLDRRSGAAVQSKVLVCEGRHGDLSMEYRGQALCWKEIPAPVRPALVACADARVRVVGVNGSGHRQKIIHGVRRPVGRRSARPCGKLRRSGRRRPGPPLRPNRSALRAPQGCAAG